jgi:hypothetical protein
MQKNNKKNPAKMAALTNRACKVGVALLALQTELKGGVEGFLQSLHAYSNVDDNDDVLQMSNRRFVYIVRSF